MTTKAGNVPGNNATLNLLTNDAVCDNTQARTVGNTSVTLIDPANGTNGYTKCCWLPARCIYHNPATGVNLWSKSWLYYRSCIINYILTETLTGFWGSGECCVITYNEIPPVANDDQSLGNVPGNNATVNLLIMTIYQMVSQATLSNTSNLDRSCYRF